MLTLLENKKQIQSAQKQFEKVLKAEKHELIPVKIGFQGDSFETKILYFPKYNFWVSLETEPNRYWNAFGLEKPKPEQNVSIICEINIPFEGIDRRIGGVFATDGNSITVLHRGKIGGSRKGIGKNLFFKNFFGRLEIIPDGNIETKFALVGNLSSHVFFKQLQLFIKQTDKIKNSPPGLKETHEEMSEDNPSDLNYDFKDEFFGKKSYKRTELIIATSNHGLIVSNLANELDARRIKYGNDNRRDLFIVEDNKISSIFEIKTDITNDSIYSAIGQLMIYSNEFEHRINKIIVLPDKLKDKIESILAKIGISILYYKLDNENVTFENLDQVVK